MRYRQLGKTDLRLSEISLGTVALGLPYGFGEMSTEAQGEPPPRDHDAIRLIHHALDRGVNFFDTARAYGYSEEVLGKALRNRRSQALIATKISCHDQSGTPLRGRALTKRMTDSLHTSLRLLQTDQVDMLMLHSASADLLRDGSAIDRLKHFKEQGKTRAIGLSTYGIDAPKLAIDAGVDALQVAYNILDQRMADDIFPLAKAAGVGIIARSIYLKGALSPKAAYLPERLKALKACSAAARRAAAQLHPPLTLVEAALKFVLAQPNNATALIGVRDIAELETSLSVLRLPPWSAEVLAQFKQLRCDDNFLLDPSKWGLP